VQLPLPKQIDESAILLAVSPQKDVDGLHPISAGNLALGRTRHLPQVCREADILVAAIRRPGFITAEFVKPGAVVIDVGINKIAGDLLKGILAADSSLVAGSGGLWQSELAGTTKPASAS